MVYGLRDVYDGKRRGDWPNKPDPLAFLGNIALEPETRTWKNLVEFADGQLLEDGVVTSVDRFVRLAKEFAIWDKIGACCLLAGARTLNGCLVPLKGTAPSNIGFTGSDYNRKTGLLGNGSKYLNSNQKANATPQDDNHVCAWKSDATSESNPYWVGAVLSGLTTAVIVGQNGFYNNSSSFALSSSSVAGLHGTARSSSGSFFYKRPNSTTASTSNASSGTVNLDHFIFAYNLAGTATAIASSRLAFYSIGNFVDLSILDILVAKLLTEVSAAIP